MLVGRAERPGRHSFPDAHTSADSQLVSDTSRACFASPVWPGFDRNFYIRALRDLHLTPGGLVDTAWF